MLPPDETARRFSAALNLLDLIAWHLPSARKQHGDQLAVRAREALEACAQSLAGFKPTLPPERVEAVTTLVAQAIARIDAGDHQAIEADAAKVLTLLGFRR